jgi:hypothetical protein
MAGGSASSGVRKSRSLRDHVPTREEPVNSESGTEATIPSAAGESQAAISQEIE